MFKPEKVNLDVKDLKYEFINGKLLERKSFDANGHEFVEIAGIKWATMNVGAKSITDAGLYFLWGDTQGYTADQVGNREGKKKFASDWSDYKFTTDLGHTFTKYNSTDNKTVLDLEDDAVHTAWGGSWRMPTNKEFDKLRDAVTNGTVTKSYTSKAAIYGLLFTENNEELFFPFGGSAYDTKMNQVNSNGPYWSSNLFLEDDSDSGSAYSTLFDKNYVEWLGNYGRKSGFMVRGVLDVK